MGSIALFMIGSALAGLAWSAESLIFFRVLQGLGGGMIIRRLTILTRTAGPARVGRVVAIVGVPMLLGPILGPILGGFLVDQVSWRWIFFINISIGIVALVASLRVLPVDQPRPTERFDALGLIQLSPGLALVIYGLAQSSSHGGFGAPEVFIPILVGLVLLALFVRHGLRSAHPLLDLRLFGNRSSQPRRRRSPCSPSRCSAACSCCRCTSRRCAASRRSRAACSWRRRASGR
jgi:EmrB/QacA subfamily drug resistance transporter